MKAGSLRHRVTIQKPGPGVQDPDTGAMTYPWQEVAQVWASIEPLSVRDFMAAGANQSEISARIVIRYRSGIDSTMRILEGGRVFNIKGVLPDPDSGREYLTLPVSEGVNDG